MFYLLVINFILHFSFTKCSKSFSAVSVCLYHTSSLRVKVIFINLLWKIFEIHKIIKAITKELEPGISSLMHTYTFALEHNYCLRIQSLVWNEVYTTYWCHILDFSEFFITSGWLGQCHMKSNLKILCPDFHIWDNYLHSSYVKVKYKQSQASYLSFLSIRTFKYLTQFLNTCFNKVF